MVGRCASARVPARGQHLRRALHAGSRRQRRHSHCRGACPPAQEETVKVALLGGAGVRVPLVVSGLLRSRAELRTDELVLYDLNPDRQRLIARLCDAMVQRDATQRDAVALEIRTAGTPEDAIEGADFIISSIRSGGAASRVADEQIALSHGVLGQETVGPGGWAMALRSIPPMLKYVELQQKLA